MYYSMFCENSSYCIWCIGLKNKQFFIFNKEYSKEEWFELANELFKQMDADWSLWTFFPASMNPFYFNDTIAYVVDDSFTKDEVTQDGYLRRDDEIRTDIGGDSEIIKVGDLEKYQCFDGEWNRRIDPEILKKVIRDEKWNYYRIVKMEYDFLVKYALPLPELHWLERIKLGFKFK